MTISLHSILVTAILLASAACSSNDGVHLDLGCSKDMKYYEKVRDYVVRTRKWGLGEFCVVAGTRERTEREMEYVVHYFADAPDFTKPPPYAIGGGESFLLLLDPRNGEIVRELRFQ